jgi:diguanylate cyclase (GGDEF)-like protein
MIGRHGQEYSIQDSAAPIWGPNDALQGVVLVFSDVSESRRLANEATHQATHDPLTGLVDRREFEKRLQRILETAKTDRSEHVVCYADLDQFKVINDTCGHVAGDEFLRQLSDALLGQARKRDTFARLGGDEFGVLMEHCAIEQGKRAAETLREVIESFLFVWEGKSFKIGASMGLVAITAASESTSDVMRQADSACYAAKDAGRHRVHIYRDDDTRLAERLGEMQWVARIQRALDESRFELYYQTIKALNPDEATGVCYEVFIRMEDEDGRIVLPGAFLPAAERYKLATKVDRWVVNQTFRWLVDHPEHQETLELVR